MFFDKIKVPQTYNLIDTPKKLAWMIDELMGSKEFSYDIENTHPTTKSKKVRQAYKDNAEIIIAGIGYAWGRTEIQKVFKPGKAAYIPLIRSDETPFWGKQQGVVLQALKKLNESGIPKIAFNGKFDGRELFRRLGWKTQNFNFDPMLAHAMIDEEKRICSRALKSTFSKQGKLLKLGISDAYLDTSASQFKKDLDDALDYYDPKLKRYHKIPLDTLYPYGCADADLTLALKFVFEELLEKENLTWVFNTIVMPLSHAIMQMEIAGAPLNIDQARKVESEQKQLMEQYSREAQDLIGFDFNVGSAAVLGKVLFEDLKLPGGVRNKHGWSVDAEALEKLDHPVKEPLSKWRRAQQIQSTYASPALKLVEEISPDGKIGTVHPNIFLDSLTGRLKCQDPNLMNLPRAENGGNIVKGMWEGEEDYYFLFKDFSQMELRVAAHVSQEPAWIEGFLRGEDMHSATAKAVFNLDCSAEEVAKLYKSKRSAAKNINFGIIYGESVWALSQKLGLTYEEADKLVNEDYFGSAPVLKNWIDNVHAFAKSEGYLTNMFGRRRHLPDAQLEPLVSVAMPKYHDRPKCYKQTVMPTQINIDPADLYSVSASSVLQGIKANGMSARYPKCLSCPHLGSCFINSEARRIKQTIERALRQSVNYIVQGSAADMSSSSLIWTTQELKRYNLRSIPILYIHDEIGCYTHKDDIEAASNILEDCMTTRLTSFTNFSVPLVTDTEIVKCWGDKK